MYLEYYGERETLFHFKMRVFIKKRGPMWRQKLKRDKCYRNDRIKPEEWFFSISIYKLSLTMHDVSWESSQQNFGVVYSQFRFFWRVSLKHNKMSRKWDFIISKLDQIYTESTLVCAGLKIITIHVKQTATRCSSV